MSVLPLIAAFFAVWVFQMCWVWFVSWLPQGSFRILSDTPGKFAFRSDAGEFTLHRDTGTLAWKHEGRFVSVKLADIHGFDHAAREDDALGSELLLGIDLTDAFRRYHDSIERHEIDFVSATHGRVTVFRSGRLQRREFLLGWLIQIEENLLIGLGVLQDVDKETGRVLRLLQARFGKGRA